MAIQGKNKRRQLSAYDETHGMTLSVDSQEEIDFLKWCDEAVSLSVITDFVYQPYEFQLADAVNYTDVDGKSRCLFRDHVYSPDFVVTFDPNAQSALAKELKTRSEQAQSAECSAWIDVKGVFNKNARSFQIDRKWTWQKFGIYICEVIPKKFFAKFGCPRKSFVSEKTKKPRTMFKGFKTISETLF